MSRVRLVFDPAAILSAGLAAAVLSMLVLGILAVLAGYPFWMPQNVIVQAFWGPEVAKSRDFDLDHTIFGLLIHVASCVFWAVVASAILRFIGSPVLAGFGAALLALLLAYGILPARMSPGWHLVLSFPAVICGFAAMGLGLWSGFLCVSGRKTTDSTSRSKQVIPPPPDLSPLTGPEAMRHPAPNVIDQRQQRIDAANSVTEDPNHNSAHYGNS